MNFLLVVAVALTARAEPPIAVPVEGKPFGAELAAVDADWLLKFDSGGKTRTMPAAELGCWGTCAEAAHGPILVTADGGLLVAELLRADKETLTADSQLFGTLKLPLKSLSGVVFHLPAGRHDRDLLLDLVAQAAGRSDRLLLENGDEITGLVNRIENDTVQMETDMGPVEIKTRRVAALVFNPTLKQKTTTKGLRAWAGLADGSRLMATRFLLDKSSLAITTAGGQTLKTSPKQLVWLQPLGGRATYLSDLKPAEYRHTPYLDLHWRCRTDHNVTGGRLRCGGRLYLKGLGVHSSARLTYKLEHPQKRFQAELGIDDSTAGRGSVRFRLLVDGRERYQSKIIRGGDAPMPISLDIEGSKQLDLVVDFADRADELDYANWLGARLIK